MISLLLLNNFYPMISYRRVQKKKKKKKRTEKESDELSYTSCPAQGVKNRSISFSRMKRRNS